MTKFCKIYKLDEEEDKDYFNNLEKTKLWNFSYFLPTMKLKMQMGNISHETFYVIEDKDSKCLGLCSLNALNKNRDELNYFEVAHKFSFANEERDFKYIGETLLAFLVKMANRENKKVLKIPCMI